VYYGLSGIGFSGMKLRKLRLFGLRLSEVGVELGRV